MLDRDILINNLLPDVGFTEFFHAFGYKPEDTIRFRLFRDDAKGIPAPKQQEKLETIDRILRRLENYNSQKYGVYFVVNGGGDNDAEVLASGIARAQFMEIDPDAEALKRIESGEISLEDVLGEQIDKIADFPLEPSIIVRTKKSLHTYWLLDGGDITQFRNLQLRLIDCFKSDPVIQNESRVMRVPGFYHRKSDPVMVKLIKFDPDLRYTQEQIGKALSDLGVPEAEEAPAAYREPFEAAAGEGEKIPEGKRHYYIVSRIGQIAAKLKDSVSDEAILAMVESDFWERCESPETVDMDKFRKQYLKTIKDFKAKDRARGSDPEFWSYAMRAWREENPDIEFNGDWEAVAAAGDRAREADKRFDNGFQDYRARIDSTFPENGSEGQIKRGRAEPLPPAAESLIDVFGKNAMVDVNADFQNILPSKEWIVEGLCTKGECAIVSGSSKSGKSYLMTNLAIAAARGELWLGKFYCQKSKVLYLNGENQIDDARERFQSCFRAMQVDPERCEQITMLCADGMMYSINQLKNILISEIQKNNYGLVILDPLYCFYEGSEIDEQDAKEFVAAIKGVCRETGVVIFCVHHHSKGAAMYKNASSRASGSGMLQRAFSTLLDVSEIDTEGMDLPEGQRAYELTGQPRQAQGFTLNLIFDFPKWVLDFKGVIPSNARNKARTAEARKNNANIKKAEEVRLLLPKVLESVFSSVAKRDDAGEFVTLGDVVSEFNRREVDVSERSIGRKIDDGVPGYARDSRAGYRRNIRRAEFAPVGDSAIPEPLISEQAS